MVKLSELRCWKWLPGMLALESYDWRWPADGSSGTDIHRYRLDVAEPDWYPDGVPTWFGGYQGLTWCCEVGCEGEWAPDLNDPATQGAIMFGILAPLGWRAITSGDSMCLEDKSGQRVPWALAPQAIEAALRMEG